MANTRRENRIEELGRVDAEKADTDKGKKNLSAEKRRIRKELQAKTGTMVKAKQGTYSKEDESIGMRLGKKKTKHDKKVARDESYGDWNKRKKDWKKAKTGSMIKAKKGFGKKLAAAATAAGAAYLASKRFGGPKLRGTNVLDYEGEAAGLHDKSALVDAADAGTKFKKRKFHPKASPLFSTAMAMSKKGGSIKARTGTMIKAKKGKKILKAATAAGAAYLASKHLGKKPQAYKNVHELGVVQDTPGNTLKKWSPGSGGIQHIPRKKVWTGDQSMTSNYPMRAKGGSIKARTGKMVKARGGAYIKTKLNGTLFTETF